MKQYNGYNKSQKKFVKRTKPNRYYVINNESPLLVRKLTLDEDTPPALCLRQFVPKSFWSKRAKKTGDNSLVPSKKAITIPSYFVVRNLIFFKIYFDLIIFI